ncbi:MAG: F0F1 ATP synthase subunit A [Elusimicrobiota bacterium]
MISLNPELVFSLKNFHVTNTMTATLLTDAVVLFFVFYLYKKISVRPGKLQNVVEIIFDYFYTITKDVTKDVAGNRGLNIFTWFMSFFIFILISNFLGLLPGYSTFGMFEHGKLAPFLRAPTSDLNMTLGLAIVSLIATHALSIKYIGIKEYLKRFFSFSPLLLFVGLLELVSEFTKLISFSFRLFGNIFAGEIVLSKVSSFLPFVAPLPFLMLEMIVAVVQALVFAMLTMVFMSILSTPHSEQGGH